MINARRARVTTGAVVTAWVLLLAAIAYGATTINYTGQTSQRRPISFSLASTSIDGLQFHIDDRCPGGRLLFVHDWGFPSMLVKQSTFGGKFVARPPQKASAIVSGTVSGTRVSGSLWDRTENKRTHKFCTGKAMFKLTPGHAEHGHG
jgi:hypothetical protein